jgi:hypothetical protein
MDEFDDYCPYRRYLELLPPLPRHATNTAALQLAQRHTGGNKSHLVYFVFLSVWPLYARRVLRLTAGIPDSANNTPPSVARMCRYVLQHTKYLCMYDNAPPPLSIRTKYIQQ